MGIEGEDYHWFLSYLKNPKQCCKVNGRVSNLDDIKYGVPKGSCLGPLVFLIYINDLPLSLKFSKINITPMILLFLSPPTLSTL